MLIKTVKLQNDMTLDVHYYKKSRLVTIELCAGTTSLGFIANSSTAPEVVRLLRSAADVLEAHDTPEKEVQK